MSAISARILGAVVTVAFVITPVATASIAGSATPAPPGRATTALSLPSRALPSIRVLGGKKANSGKSIDVADLF